ncbi:MAG: RNA polymerase sigma factor [Alistipes sp.]|nr:RNA polymerase sigma factor [Alistipes sp.]
MRQKNDHISHCGTAEATDGERFSTLVERYTEPLYRHVRRMVGAHEESEDIVQETFARAWNCLPRFLGSDDMLRSWLYRIATNAALDALRRRRRWIFTSLDTLSKQAVEDAGPAWSEEREIARFQQAVAELPLKQKLVFQMRYYDEMTYEEIASVVGGSVGSSKTNYHYAAEKIRKRLTENIDTI